MTDVCVILVNFKTEKKTADCIRSLEKGTVKPTRVYVIDNASTEASQKYFESLTFSIDVRWIWNKENPGAAAGWNIAIRSIQAEHMRCYVWLLNNDTVVAPTALEKILEKAEATNAGITGSLVKKANGDFSGGVAIVHPKFATVRRPQSPEEQGFDYVEGSSFMISPECLQKMGPLSEDYFLYFEESDYCYKAKRNGFSLAWATDSVVYHDIGSSTGSEIAKGKVPFFIDCLMIRNRIHFALKNGFPTFSVLIGLAISLALRIKRSQFKRAFVIPKIILSETSFKRFIEENGGNYEIQK